MLMVTSELKNLFPDAVKKGLESIYAIETVDIKSIRKMAEPPKKILHTVEVEDSELTLDLGVSFRNWIPPTTLLEPIQILELKKPIEKNLLDRGIVTLGDLEQAFDKIKNLGQGNIDDVQRALNQYLSGKPKRKTQKLDFVSLLKCLFGDLERKKVYAALAPYGLADWIVLSPLDRMDLKKISPEIREEWIKEIKIKSDFLHSQLTIWAETWIKPWLMRRRGFATHEEIDEFLMLRALDEDIAEKALAFLQISYKSVLPHVDNVFAANLEHYHYLQLIHAKRQSYLCSPFACYKLDELTHLIYQECVAEWHSISPEVIDKALCLITQASQTRQG